MFPYSEFESKEEFGFYNGIVLHLPDARKS
jgi:hypothetical protein